MDNINTPNEVLQREFLGIRARLIDVAASLDRIDRAKGPPLEDPRMERIRQGIAVLGDDGSNRAEKIELIFSLPYEEEWRQQDTEEREEAS